MRFYTNVQMVGDHFLVLGYENGRHFATREKFYPTLLVPSKKKTKYKKQLKNQNQKGEKELNDMSQSFLDFLTKNQNKRKQAFKSLAYNDQQLRKIRALYGRRGTFCCTQTNFDYNTELHQKKAFQIEQDEILQVI